MILWASKEDLEDRGENMPCRAFRWTFQIAFKGHPLYWHIGFVHQHQDKKTLEWDDSHTNVIELYLTSHFHLGFEHFWYDGPHCIFSLGFLHFIYSGMNQGCRECSGET